MRGTATLVATAIGAALAASGGNAGPQPPIVIPRDTPVVLMATREVRSDEVAPGTVFPLRVDQPVRVGGMVVVPVGTPAFGEVMTARGARRLGRVGVLEVRLSHIQLGDLRIPLAGERSARGHGGAPLALTVKLAGPIGLMHRANNAKIKAGDLLDGFVAEDVTLPAVAASAP